MNNKIEIRKLLKAKRIDSPLGPIESLQPLGEGGNGLVYSGRLANHSVAVKFLADDGHAKLNRFKAEYVAIALLPDHPNVVKPLAYGELDLNGTKVPFIVMRLFDGCFQRKPKQLIDQIQLVNFLKALAEGVRHLHNNGVIHRDLKPENVFRQGNQLAIGDFGIASYAGDFYQRSMPTESGELLGNRAFSAPEQLKVITAHKTMDIFAIGQLCQWYATGDVHRGTNRVPISRFVNGAENIDSLVERCLANSPDDRYQNCDDLLSAIDAFELALAKPVARDSWADIHLFHDAIVESFPNHAELTMSLNPDDTDRFLTNLAKRDFGYELWWSMGPSSNSIEEIELLKKNVWLIDGMELKADKIAIFSNSGGYNEFAVIQSTKMPPFGIYDKIQRMEEAGLIDREHYISLKELQNGYARITGKIVSLKDRKIERRVRFTSPTSILFMVRKSCAFQQENQDQVKELLDCLNSAGDISELIVRRFAKKFGKFIDTEIRDSL